MGDRALRKLLHRNKNFFLISFSCDWLNLSSVLFLSHSVAHPGLGPQTKRSMFSDYLLSFSPNKIHIAKAQLSLGGKQSYRRIHEMKVLATQSWPIPLTPWTHSPRGFSVCEFSRQEYWSSHFPDFPNPGIEPWSAALQADSLIQLCHQGSPSEFILKCN